MLVIILWSICLSSLWGLSMAIAVVFNILALTVGIRYVSLNSIKSDQRSFYLYNVGVLLLISDRYK